MPELPEVEIARRNLVRWWEGKAAEEVVVVDEKLLRETSAEELVEALRQPARRLERYGKYIVARMADDSTVLIHFRMTGKIVRCDEPEPKYARLAWRVPETGWLVFKDQRRLGTVRLLGPGEFEDYEPVQKMGPDALEIDGPTLCERLPKRRMLKASLLDQEVLAGLGNIAAIEIMWRMKLPPRIKGGALSDAQCDQLARTIVEFVETVIEREQSDEVVYMEESRDDNPFDIYLREGEPCPRCGTEIERVKVSGRSTYYCPNCQDE
ncbi:MAG: Fpg/Nei family DNA glycosylase [Persicimonas sp.]